MAALAVALAFAPGLTGITAAFPGIAFMLGPGNGAVSRLVPKFFPGPINSAFRGLTWGSISAGRIFGSAFGPSPRVEPALVAVLLALGVTHDFSLGPTGDRACCGPARGLP